MPSGSPTADATPKQDPLFKGDDLKPNEAKRKITLQIDEDTWVRYQIDQKPAHMLIVRKGHYLAVKATEKLSIEVNDPKRIHYKTRGGSYLPVTEGRFSVEENGKITPLTTSLGGAIPDQVPPSNH